MIGLRATPSTAPSAEPSSPSRESSPPVGSGALTLAQTGALVPRSPFPDNWPVNAKADPPRPRARSFDAGVVPATDSGTPDPGDVTSERQQMQVLEAALQAQHEADEERTAEVIAGLHALHQKLTEAQDTLDLRQQQSDQRAAALDPAVGHLRVADEAMAEGSLDVDDDLRQAQESLAGPAHMHLGQARQALSQGDLFDARVQTELAIASLMTNPTLGRAPSMDAP